MTSSERRPLWRPFSESPAHEPSPTGRLTAVERAPVEQAPFLEPAEAPRPVVPGTRRPLGPGGLAADTADS